MRNDMRDMQQVDWDSLPVPIDDKKAEHLKNLFIEKDIILESTSKKNVNLKKLEGLSVIFFYPRTGHPEKPVPPGWNLIAGARGCTPQSCSYRDYYEELKSSGVNNIFGISTQDPDYQLEAKDRLHLPFDLLSDNKLELVSYLNLPIFEFNNEILNKRLTLIIKDKKIIKYFYPVFPPDKDVLNVIKWIEKANP